MAKSSQPPEPFRAVELPDGSDPISKGAVQRVRRESDTVVVDVTVEGLGESLAERIIQQVRGAARRTWRARLRRLRAERL